MCVGWWLPTAASWPNLDDICQSVGVPRHCFTALLPNASSDRLFTRRNWKPTLQNHVRMCIYIYTDVYVYLYKHIHTYIHAYIHKYIHAYLLRYYSVCACIFTCAHRHKYTTVCAYIYIHIYGCGYKPLSRALCSKPLSWASVWSTAVFNRLVAGRVCRKTPDSVISLVAKRLLGPVTSPMF